MSQTLTHTQFAQEVNQFQEPANSLKHWLFPFHDVEATFPFHRILTVNGKDK